VARMGKEAVVQQLLVKKGAEIQVKDKNGRTALYWASRIGRDRQGGSCTAACQERGQNLGQV
jgi:ankyrin repeat protein